jgi:hypothetical protein
VPPVLIVTTDQWGVGLTSRSIWSHFTFIHNPTPSLLEISDTPHVKT